MRKFIVVLSGLAIILTGTVAYRAYLASKLSTIVASSPSSLLSPTKTMETVSPTAVYTPSVTASLVPSPSSVVTKPATVNKVVLSVPFTVQAPDADWSEPWDEGCEEAALLMVDAYLKGDRSEKLPEQKTKEQIKQMVTWEERRFGGHYDLGVADIAVIAKEYLGYQKIRVETNGTFGALRDELRAGHPVILPAAGQLLKNPYFKQPGPPYHVFVLTGFDGNEFIANENGTRRGADYRYSQQTLEAAWHDYQKDQPSEAGPRSYLVLENS